MASGNAVPIALGAVLLGGLAIAAMGQGSAQASTAGGPPVIRTGGGTDPPKSVVDRVVAAVQTRDPGTMRKLADELEIEGWTIQAYDLRQAADIAAFLNATGLTMPGQKPGDKKPTDGTQTSSQVQGDVRAPGRPQPWSPIPGLIGAMDPEPDIDVQRLLAQRLVREMEKPKGSEDRAVVKAFQVANQLKSSGNYTPGTAILLAERYGLVPPCPYWPTNGRVKSKANYRGRLLAIAKRDPQRAEEFERAAQEIDQ